MSFPVTVDLITTLDSLSMPLYSTVAVYLPAGIDKAIEV